MEIYLLGSAIAFVLTIIMILIEEALLLKLSRVERLHYESSESKFCGRATLKGALTNAVLSWVGVVFALLAFIMLAVNIFAIKR